MDWEKKSRKHEDWDRDVYLNNQGLIKIGRWTTKINKLNKIDSTND